MADILRRALKLSLFGVFFVNQWMSNQAIESSTQTSVKNGWFTSFVRVCLTNCTQKLSGYRTASIFSKSLEFNT